MNPGTTYSYSMGYRRWHCLQVICNLDKHLIFFKKSFKTKMFNRYNVTHKSYRKSCFVLFCFILFPMMDPCYILPIFCGDNSEAQVELISLSQYQWWWSKHRHIVNAIQYQTTKTLNKMQVQFLGHQSTSIQYLRPLVHQNKYGPRKWRIHVSMQKS